MEKSVGGQSVLSKSVASVNKKQEDVVIRTMQDDIASVKKTKQTATKIPDQLTTPREAVSVVDNVTMRKSKEPASTNIFPFPSPNRPVLPIPNIGSNKVVMSPTHSVEKKMSILSKLMIAVFIFLIMGAVGALGWVYFDDFSILGGDSTVDIPKKIVDIESMIPSSALMVVSYNISTEQDRLDILNSWEGASNEDASENALLSGDPRFLLDNVSVSQLHYILLPEDSRPFLLIPHTAETAVLMQDISRGEVLSKDGWYILHAFDTKLFTDKLKNGSLADNTTLPVDFNFSKYKIGLMLSKNMIDSLKTSWGGNAFAGGIMKDIYLNGNITDQGSFLQLAGTTELPNNKDNILVTDQRLLEAVPSDVNIVRFGANFFEDLTSWQTESQILDSNLLEAPAVKNFISSLQDSPYAYFLLEREDGLSEAGVIIKMTDTVKSKVLLGDAGLEGALPVLMPLLSDRESNAGLAFAYNTHNGVSLRYVNINGPKQALDYAILDDYILIATSREGMFNLIDTVLGDKSSLNKGITWQGVLESWGTIPQAKDIVFGRMRNSALSGLLPISTGGKEVIFGFSVIAGSSVASEVSGVLLLSNHNIVIPQENSKQLFE